jgi:predicted CXXCH cytochrome family protein
LLETSNPDVPTCTGCHGTHTQEDPTTAAFRLKSPNICGGCHGNAALMQKYGISTEVFNTYVSDFHGTTVTLFERQHPDQPTNKAVCTDCHGIHNILAVTDVNATVVKENLLATCQRCHPDATADFPASWVGHFPPSRTNQPLVYFVNLFYKILVPAVIGAMVLFVGLDFVSRIMRRIRRKGA